MDLKYRWANIDDADSLNILVNSGYRGESSKKGWTTEADLLGGQRTDSEKIREMIVDAHTKILLLELSRKVVGCVLLERDGLIMKFGMFVIDPVLQGSGLGKKLMQKAEDFARDEGVRKMEMTVISVRQELIEYYLRRGYKRTGRTEPFPMDDVRFGEPKVKHLEFVVLEKDLA